MVGPVQVEVVAETIAVTNVLASVIVSVVVLVEKDTLVELRVAVYGIY